ncbi:hypothetical protein [Stenotrophomonas maltophilia]|jgi:hypothetical protein|uniref:hypothetical protein n=1 Tax=Stenotrophomonas maltophilia TaxID=40324 RepID=UPI0018DEE831|nr:hypothetical protein [Stenotrophomonas maltophilia]
MSQDNIKKEFHRGPQMTVQMQLTTEQYAAMKEWSASIPTLHFLDICVVNATKLSAAALQNDTRKASYVNRLQSLDRSQHCFSYLCALIEKVSDTRGSASDSELEEQVLNDMAALRAFFKNARVYEPDDFVISYLRDLRRAPHELARPSYLSFLDTINNQSGLKDPVSPALRFQKATEILTQADALSIARQHPVVLLPLACLYGNQAARKLMKFKADPQKFNAENALADIMAISRFASLKLEVEHIGRQGGGYMRSEFLTDDDGLVGVFKCFEAKAVRHEQKGDTYESRIEVSVKLEELLPDLAAKRRIARASAEGAPEQEPDEYEQILNLLVQAP